tara:strand:- start:764 stop:1324 length:561 start_codon:yes stop_codon:yes gene_type:complete
MSQLIALIIAIALGAIVTAIGYVFLGDAFTSNSERGVALQLVNQASQVEMAMTAYRAVNAGDVWTASGAAGTDAEADFTTVMTNDPNGLVTGGFMKDIPIAPTNVANFGLQNNSGDIYLVLNAANTELSNDVCLEIRQLAGEDADDEIADATIADTNTATLVTALDTDRYNCFTNGTNNVFFYSVE